MPKIIKPQILETSNSQGSQEQITSDTNSQLIQILPIKLKKGELIGKEIPGIKGYISKIIRKEKIGVTDLTRVETSESEELYIDNMGEAVYIKYDCRTNTEYLMMPNGKPIIFMGKEIIQGDYVFNTSNFHVVNVEDDLGGISKIDGFEEITLGSKKISSPKYK